MGSVNESYSNLYLETMLQKKKAKLDDDENVEITADSAKQPPASVTGVADFPAALEAVKGLVREIVFKYGKDQRALDTVKEFDDVLSRVFQPAGGTENYTNLRSPGLHEAKVTASPGQSGSSTGKPGAGTGTYPNNERATTKPYAGQNRWEPTLRSPQADSSFNPKVVERGDGATRGFYGTTEGPVGTPREGSSGAGVGYNPLKVEVAKLFGNAVGQHTSQLVGQTHKELSKGFKLEYEEGKPLKLSYSDDEEADTGLTGNPNVQIDEGFDLPTDETTISRFEQEEVEERGKIEEAQTRGDNDEAEKHARKAYLAKQRADILKSRRR